MLSLLSIFHIVKRLSKLRFRRSPMFEQGRTARVLRFIGSTFAFLYLVFVGMLLGLATRGESDGPVLLMAMVPLMLIVDFMLRFLTQEMPEMQLRPWLLLPVPRRKVVEAFLLADILSSYNLIWLAAFVPFGIVAVVVGQQPWAVLCAVAGCQVLMMANSLFWVSVRLLMAHRVLWLMLAAVVFVITLAVEVVDEVLLQGVGYALRHVIIDLRNTERHADGLVVTVHGTRISLHSRIIEVDTRIDATVFRRVVLQLPAQAARPHGTGL